MLLTKSLWGLSWAFKPLLCLSSIEGLCWESEAYHDLVEQNVAWCRSFTVSVWSRAARLYPG